MKKIEVSEEWLDITGEYIHLENIKPYTNHWRESLLNIDETIKLLEE